jgi:uncharacterized integral membrane protein
MQIFLWILFLIVLSIAIFAVQNSDAPAVVIRFLFWKFETSLTYTILGSILLGILLTLVCWIPWAIRSSRRREKDNQKISSN